MTEKLQQFTPLTTLNRDEMLYQMGRASVRPARLWKWLAAVLAVSQTATVAGWLLWNPAGPVTSNPPAPTINTPALKPAPITPETPSQPSNTKPVPAQPPVVSPSSEEPNSYLTLMQNIRDDLHVKSLPASSESRIPTQQLTAGSRLQPTYHINY